ncbi:MAG: hypothetical protein K0V04_31240 [Deltaproteobacteria bacterium]|nr:hypothetical protein [Deltaproteobacteria bacterium]
MSRSTTILSLLLPALTGGAAGLAVLFVAPPTVETSATNSAHDTAAVKPKTARRAPPTDLARPLRSGSLSRPLTEPPTPTPPVYQDAVDSFGEDTSPSDELEPEQRRELALESWEGQLDEHRGESIEPAWANGVEPQFEADLRALGDGAFEVSDVDCRTESCLATLQFDSFEDARSSLGDLLHSRYQVNCGTTTVMVEPDDTLGPYSAELLFDCASARGV